MWVLLSWRGLHGENQTCHSYGVQGRPRASLSINISLLAELCVWRAIDFDRMGNHRAKFRWYKCLRGQSRQSLFKFQQCFIAELIPLRKLLLQNRSGLTILLPKAFFEQTDDLQEIGKSFLRQSPNFLQQGLLIIDGRVHILIISQRFGRMPTTKS